MALPESLFSDGESPSDNRELKNTARYDCDQRYRLTMAQTARFPIGASDRTFASSNSPQICFDPLTWIVMLPLFAVSWPSDYEVWIPQRTALAVPPF
jgi:hypothetical protein